jgi:hypothetical protein
MMKAQNSIYSLDELAKLEDKYRMSYARKSSVIPDVHLEE